MDKRQYVVRVVLAMVDGELKYVKANKQLGQYDVRHVVGRGRQPGAYAKRDSRGNWNLFTSDRMFVCDADVWAYLATFKGKELPPIVQARPSDRKWTPQFTSAEQAIAAAIARLTGKPVRVQRPMRLLGPVVDSTLAKSEIVQTVRVVEVLDLAAIAAEYDAAHGEVVLAAAEKPKRRVRITGVRRAVRAAIDVQAVEGIPANKQFSC